MSFCHLSWLRTCVNNSIPFHFWLMRLQRWWWRWQRRRRQQPESFTLWTLFHFCIMSHFWSLHFYLPCERCVLGAFLPKHSVAVHTRWLRWLCCCSSNSIKLHFFVWFIFAIIYETVQHSVIYEKWMCSCNERAIDSDCTTYDCECKRAVSYAMQIQTAAAPKAQRQNRRTRILIYISVL